MLRRSDNRPRRSGHSRALARFLAIWNSPLTPGKFARYPSWWHVRRLSQQDFKANQRFFGLVLLFCGGTVPFVVVAMEGGAAQLNVSELLLLLILCLPLLGFGVVLILRNR